MGDQRSGIILAIVMSGLVAGLALILSGPAQPAVVRELVALAPAGSKVTVTHDDKDMWGSDGAHWEWSFESADPPSAIAAHRAWFVEQGIPVAGPVPDAGWPFPETYLAPADGVGPSVVVPPGDGTREVVENGKTITLDMAVPGTTVVGTLSDESIGADGQLLR